MNKTKKKLEKKSSVLCIKYKQAGLVDEVIFPAPGPPIDRALVIQQIL